jgi:hypothetical protein
VKQLIIFKFSDDKAKGGAWDIRGHADSLPEAHQFISIDQKPGDIFQILDTDSGDLHTHTTNGTATAQKVLGCSKVEPRPMSQQSIREWLADVEEIANQLRQEPRDQRISHRDRILVIESVLQKVLGLGWTPFTNKPEPEGAADETTTQ